MAVELLCVLQNMFLTIADFFAESLSLQLHIGFSKTSLNNAFSSSRLCDESVTSGLEADVWFLHVFLLEDICILIWKQQQLAKTHQVLLQVWLQEIPHCHNADFTGRTELWQTGWACSVYKSVMSKIKQEVDPTKFCVKGKFESPSSYIRMVQFYSDKSATTLKSNALVAYPLHGFFLNATKEFKRILIDHKDTLTAFLPVSSTLKEADEEDFKELRPWIKSLFMHASLHNLSSVATLDW